MDATSPQRQPGEKEGIVEEQYAYSDSDVLSIKDAARGDNLPDNYFLSVGFIGTVLVCSDDIDPGHRLP